MNRKEKWKRLFIILLATFFCIHFFSSISYQLSPFFVQAGLSLSFEPRTSFLARPFGEIQARTHLSPVHIYFSLKDIHLESLEELVMGREIQDLLPMILLEGRGIISSLLLKILFLGGLGGGLGVFLLSRERESIWEGVILGLLITCTLLALLCQTYDVQAFSNLEYLGMLETAPWIIAFVEEGMETIHLLGRKMELMTQNLDTIYTGLKEMDPPGDLQADLQILHVSDIHNNPVAFTLIKEMLATFSPHLIIDTGDLTDYGTVLEAEIASSIALLEVPYLFVPGNHDSPAVISYLQELPNVTILSGNDVNFQGLMITGLQDPSATDRSLKVQDEAIGEYQERLKVLISQSNRRPDIVAVHNFQVAEPLLGEVPTILHGHTHSQGFSQREGTVIIDAGTTGGAGIRGLNSDGEIPYSFSLLHYRRDDVGWTLMAVDLISLWGQGGGFQMKRIPIHP